MALSAGTEEKIARTANEALQCKEASSRTSPLLARAYRHRSEALHVIVERALSAVRDSVTPQLLLLGAGLDTSYEKLYEASVFAVDLPSVMQQRTVEQKSVGIIADLRDVSALTKGLADSGFDFGINTVILVEMVLNYLSSNAVEQLLSHLSMEFTKQGGHPILVCYDYFKLSERSDFSRVMQDAFRARGAPLEHVLTKRKDQHAFLHGAGWSTTCVKSMGATLATFHDKDLIVNSVFRTAHTQGPTSFFDEHASLALLQKHYHVTIAGISAASAAGKEKDTLLQLLADLGLSAKYRSNGGTTLPGMPQEESIAVPGSSPIIFIRRLQQLDDRVLSDASELYTTTMRPYSDKYPAVGKFTKKAGKQIRNPWLHFKAPGGEEGYTLWVAEVDNAEAEGARAVVGLVGVRGPSNSSSPRTRGELELCHMAVEESCRGKGVGTSLLRAALSYLQQLPLPSLSSWSLDLTVLVDLRQAQSLYSRAGFVPVGEPTTLHSETGPPCSLQRMSLGQAQSGSGPKESNKKVE